MAPTTLADMLAHEPFNAGRELINAGKFEMAIEHFSSLLETTKEESGELSEAVAPVYYQYGAALYLQAEDASTVFANGVADGGDNGDDEDDNDDAGSERNGGSGEVENESGDTGDSAVESAVRDTVEANAAVIEDLEIAWEVLEVARSILTPLAGNEAPAARELLARVHLKLGDVQKLNGQFSGALADYEQCLALRRLFLAPHDRGLADVHYQLAQTAEYAAADVVSAAEAEPSSTASGPSGANSSSSSSSCSSSCSSSSSSTSSEGPSTSSSSSSTAVTAATLRAQSLQNYEACRDVFQLMVNALKAKAAAAVSIGSDTTSNTEDTETPAGTSPTVAALNTGLEAADGAVPAVPGLSKEEAEELADFGEILKELHETIASARDGTNLADVRAVLPTKAPEAGAASKQSSGSASISTAGVTTIGFGSSSSSSSNPPSTATAASTTGIMDNSTHSTETTSTSTAPAMLVAKKKKRATPEPVAIAEGQEKCTLTHEASDEKKAKIE